LPEAPDQPHAFGDVPARAEEVHHVAFGAQALVALDHEEIMAVVFQQDGQCEPGDACPRDQDLAVDGHARFLWLRN
jgi:hypothetical protein